MVRWSVYKFGGSSMGSLDRIGQVARRIASQRDPTRGLVVVVSAMQGETDRLLQGAQALCGAAPWPLAMRREVDQLLATGEQAAAALLALALQREGVDACSLSALQLGLRTDGAFNQARILQLDQAPLAAAAQRGRVVVASGFAGSDAHGNVTTLGRGGSDTSAVAIAAALRADCCTIFTDVLGVYTADPRICPRARKLTHITFDEMMEMASLGAKVLQIRSVELAMNHDVPLQVCSTFADDPGTRVGGAQKFLEHSRVAGISHAGYEAKLTLRQLPNQPATLARLFAALAAGAVNIDVIVQNVAEAGCSDLSFTVPRRELERAQQLCREQLTTLGASRLEVDAAIGKVSIVGVGMMSHPGVAATMFGALEAAAIAVQIITTSEIKITCVVAEDDVGPAVRALHDAFALHEPAP